MIPLRDLNPPTRPAIVTYVIIAINVAVFLYQWTLGAAEEDFIRRFGVVPFWLTHASRAGAWITPFTSMFMHGGLLHVASNMWFLHIFGDNIEDALGRVRYVIFYLACGLAAVAAQVLMGPSSTVPMVGASGAIAGVLGGYIILYPRARVLTLIPIFIFMQIAQIPAVAFVLIWFALQLLGGLGSLGRMNMGGVAFFAHIGGFLTGLALIKLLRGKPPTRPSYRVRYVPRDSRPDASRWS